MLLVLTAISIFVTQWRELSGRFGPPFDRLLLSDAARFTVSLLAILVAHESGHYIAARIHRVPASPPFFIPMPVLSPFGTMGAFIRMRARIPTRNALLDIGASGPLAGLAVAIPIYFYGAAHSHFVPLIGGGGGVLLGESLLLKTLDFLAAGRAPAGMELNLSPYAYAGWAGFFVTMINLLPVSQLDGGHVAFSLFGRKQDRAAVFLHRSLLALFFVNLGSFLLRDVRAGIGLVSIGRHVMTSAFWLVWFEVIAVIASLSAETESTGLSNRLRLFGTIGLIVLGAVGEEHDASGTFWLAWFAGLALLLTMEFRSGALRATPLLDHPATDAAPLSPVRRVIGYVTLIFFGLLFMPAPMSM